MARSAIHWIQGVYASSLDSRLSAASKRWGVLGLLLTSAIASFEGLAKAISIYVLGQRQHPGQQALVEQRFNAYWSHECIDSCDDASSLDEPLDSDDEDSSNCSVADTVYSLPDIVSHPDIDATEHLYRSCLRTLNAVLPKHCPSVQPACRQPSLIQQLACGTRAIQVPRQLFVPFPSSKGNRQQRRLACRSLLSISKRQPKHSVQRSPTSCFAPSQLLLLPAPIFLPEAIEVGLFCDQGQRSCNEDMAFAMRLDPTMHDSSCFQKAVCWGVFDGHGGVEVAEHLTDRLPELVSKRCNNIKKQGADEIATIMLGLETDLVHKYHAEWQPEERDPGSTALVASIMDDTLLIANVGDCRLLLISEAVDHLGNRTAYVSNTTSDHHCSRNPQEARRVQAAGATIDEAGYIGSLLEVSRSIGDFQTKLELGSDVIIAQPEVYSWKLGPQDLMVVAVSDGISGVMNDMEICNMVCTQLNEKRRMNDPAHAARELASFAALTSSDNCSAVVVVLKDQPPPAPARRRLFGRKT